MKLWAILPELCLGALCLALVPLSGLAQRRPGLRLLPLRVAVAGLAAAMVLTARMLPWAPVGAMEGIYAVDGFAHVFKLLIQLGALVTLLLLPGYFRRRSPIAHAPAAILFATLGAAGLSSSLDLGLILLFLEMMSLAGYVLATLVRAERRALEAGLKYFLFGAAALSIMAYGLSLLYGLTGTLDLRAIAPALERADPVWVAVALALVLAGYGFELTLVPFHFWSPDTIDGAAAPISGFLTVVPKIAGVAGLLRLLVQGFPGAAASWPAVLAVLAAATMTLGNLVALRQRRVKRLLAWSSVAQAGYVLVAVAAGADIPAAGYYLGAYLFMNLGAFAVVAQVERATGDDSLATLRGLGRRAPAAAVALALSLLSLAGIPPLAGFAGKVLVLTTALDHGMAWLAVVAALNMAVALAYYVRVIAAMLLHSTVESRPLAWRGADVGAAALTLGGTLALGVAPGPALALITQAAEILR